MNKINTPLIFLILIFITSSVFAQPTWITAPNVDAGGTTLNHDSLNVGASESVVLKNGSVVALTQINQDQLTFLQTLDANGNLLYTHPASHSTSGNSESSFSLQPGPDNSAIYVLRHTGASSYDEIRLTDSTGTQIWQNHIDYTSSSAKLLFNVTASFHNTFYLQFEDSLVEVNSAGLFIRSSNFSATSITAIPDSDFISENNSVIIRRDFAGNIAWTTPLANSSVATANLTDIYALRGDSVIKINTSTGAIIWQHNSGARKLATTSDGGFICLIGGTVNNPDAHIAKFDNAGIIEWDKNYQFAHYGLKTIAELQPDIYLTGGEWRNINLNQQFIAYSPFFATVDSIGKGVIDSTTYYCGGNANDNNRVSFFDDGVYIAAAINSTGIPRKGVLNSVQNTSSIFGTDWSGSFAVGLNYKFCDYDGSGVIDSSDFSLLQAQIPFYGQYAFPEYQRTSAAPKITFSLEDDSVTVFDTVTVHVTLGSTALNIDSVYSLGFAIGIADITGTPFFNQVDLAYPGLTLNDSSNAVFVRTSAPAPSNPFTYIEARQNHLNAVQAGDTIVTLRMHISPAFYSVNQWNDTLLPFSIQVKAITKEGFNVPLQISSDSLFVFSPLTKIDEINNQLMSVYPVPAMDELIIANSSKGELTIYDQSGNKIKEAVVVNNNYELNVSGLPSGFYYFTFKTQKGIQRNRFIVSR